jgi:hypothetical protein
VLARDTTAVKIPTKLTGENTAGQRSSGRRNAMTPAEAPAPKVSQFTEADTVPTDIAVAGIAVKLTGTF